MDIKKVIWAILRGSFDSIMGMRAIFYVDKELKRRKLNQSSPNTPIRRRESDISKETTTTKKGKPKEDEDLVWKRTMQCSVFNGGIFLTSVLLFEIIIYPFLQYMMLYSYGDDSETGNSAWNFIGGSLKFIFQCVWVLPLLLLSKIVNCLWFQDIADHAYKYSHGRPILKHGLSKIIADSLFSVAVQFLFLIQATIVEKIPLYIVAKVFASIHMCLLYSLYTFEYKWYNMGWELHRRLSYIETNWPYFIGFGLPLTFLTELSSSWIVNGCIFAVLFPFFIMSGNEANPISNVPVYPLRLFSFVIGFCNAVLNKCIQFGLKKRNATNTPTHKRR